MNAEQKARLFRRFEQAEGARTSARYGGSGLGLAISQELAAAMGGTIEVDSTPGEGTRFSVRLPLPPALQPGTLEEGVVEPPRGVRRSSLSLLLVEDDPTVADVLTGLLRLQGHMSCMRRTGWPRWRRWPRIRSMPRLLDLDLPGMDGLALARQLRIQGFDKPLIAITARADSEAEPQSQQAGFDHFIRKPVTMAMLAALLDRAVPAPPWRGSGTGRARSALRLLGRLNLPRPMKVRGTRSALTLQRALSSCTASTSAPTCSGFMSGDMPWPRLNTWPSREPPLPSR